jgi:hypothetical protein
MSSSGTVFVNIIWDGVFVFEETGNTTDGAVVFTAGKREFDVEGKGDFQLQFTATNFTLKDPPVGFPGGDPAWLQLEPGYTSTQFTMSSFNSGEVKNQSGTFLIHKDDGTTVDPTVVNNPNPPSVRVTEPSYHGEQVPA